MNGLDVPRPGGQKLHDSVNERLSKLVTALSDDCDEIDFPEFLEGAGRLLCEDTGEPLTAEQTRQIVRDLMPHMPTWKKADGKYNQRFEEIVTFIQDWEKEGTHLTGNGRLGKVLLGSFEAAKDEEVLEALRFVYNDIAPF
ncbi:unnamed protein product, partial [Effrenium voratum]